MVYQFATWDDTTGGLWPGGLSAVEYAFEVLGWDDPYPVPSSCCYWPQGCKKRGDSGTPVAEDHPVYGGMRYVWTCHEHSPRELAKS